MDMEYIIYAMQACLGQVYTHGLNEELGVGIEEGKIRRNVLVWKWVWEYNVSHGKVIGVLNI